MKFVYFRRVKGGGLHLIQLIIGPIIIGYSRNRSWSNGKIGREIYIKQRNQTLL